MATRESVGGGPKKDQRMYAHIRASSAKKGRSSPAAKRIAAATANKKRAQEGRAKATKTKNSH